MIVNQKIKTVKKNNVLNRYLPLNESVLKGLESEPKITDFTLIKELGVGSFGRVLLVQHKVTQAQYAIKAIDKRNKENLEEMPYFRREIEIMYRIHHPNVVKLFGHFEDNTYCYFIMEYIPGGNIYSLVPKNGIPVISTKMVASLMKDVISATYYLHHMIPPIVHRDIKPENVLLAEGNVAKLTDFGWSNYMEGFYKRTTICGTPIYLAPEIINNTGHDEKIDIWCIGVLMFELLTGLPPWKGDDITTLKYNISRLKINWQKNMDPDAIDLISKILRYIPEERISLRGMLMHPFFTKFFPDAVNCLKIPDNTKYKVYIISKDHPLTWNPVYSGSTIEYRPKQYLGQSVITTNLNHYNYDFNNSLKVSSLPKASFTQLRTGGFSTMIPSVSSASITREILENQERIKQLVRGTEVRPNASLYNNSFRESEPYQSLYLSSANNYLRDGSLYQSTFKTQSPSYYLSNGLTNSMTNSITNNMTNSITNNMANSITNNMANSITNNMTNSITNNMTNSITNNMANSITNNMANSITNNMTNSITNNLSNSLTNNLSNSLTNNLTNSLTNNFTNSLTNGMIINGNNIYYQSITPSSNLNSITSSNANILLALNEQDRLRSIRPTPTLINISQSLPISKTIK